MLFKSSLNTGPAVICIAIFTTMQAPYSAEHLKPLKKSFYKNQLMRQFEQTAPNLVWVSDITFVKVGKQYYGKSVHGRLRTWSSTGRANVPDGAL